MPHRPQNTAPDRYCFACADESLKYNQAYSNMSAKCQDYYMIKMMNGFFYDKKAVSFSQLY